MANTVKYDVKNSGHRFEKTNLITLRSKGGSYDVYTCKDCGLKGKRYGLNAHIDAPKKTCKRPPQYPESVKTIAKSVESVGLENDTKYETVLAPLGEEKLSGVWVFSQERQEPVRLLPYEYVVLEGGSEQENAATNPMETPHEFAENDLVMHVYNGLIYLVRHYSESLGEYLIEKLPEKFAYWNEQKQAWDIRTISPSTLVWAKEKELKAFTPTDWEEHADQEDAILALQARLDELAAKQFNKEAYRWHKRLIDAWGYVRMYRRQLCNYYADLRANGLEVPSILPYWVTRDKGEMRRTLLQVKRLRENMQRLQK